MGKDLQQLVIELKQAKYSICSLQRSVTVNTEEIQKLKQDKSFHKDLKKRTTGYLKA